MDDVSTVRRPFIDVNRVTCRFCATLLVFEAVVFVLYATVAGALTGLHMGLAWATGGGLALVAVVLCGLLRYRWAYYAGSALQLVVIACGVVVPAMYLLGVIFTGLWLAALWCGRIAHPHER